jgi:hypothetical protein
MPADKRAARRSACCPSQPEFSAGEVIRKLQPFLTRLARPRG